MYASHTILIWLAGLVADVVVATTGPHRLRVCRELYKGLIFGLHYRVRVSDSRRPARISRSVSFVL